MCEFPQRECIPIFFFWDFDDIIEHHSFLLLLIQTHCAHPVKRSNTERVHTNSATGLLWTTAFKTYLSNWQRNWAEISQNAFMFYLLLNYITPNGENILKSIAIEDCVAEIETLTVTVWTFSSHPCGLCVSSHDAVCGYHPEHDVLSLFCQYQDEDWAGCKLSEFVIALICCRFL